MQLDNKFEYKIGDKVKHIALAAIFQIVDIQNSSKGYFGSGTCYRLKNTSYGCTDHDIWINSYNFYRFYSPASSAAKLLFSIHRGSEATNPQVANKTRVEAGVSDGD